MQKWRWDMRDVAPVHLAWLASVVAVIGLSSSKAALSISTGALAFAAVWQMVREGSLRGLWRNKAGSLQSVLFFLPLASVLYTEHYSIWLEDIVIKLPLLALPLAYSILPDFSEKQFFAILAAFIITLSIISVLTLVHYYQDYALITESIKYNKHISITRKTSHIHFGLMLAFSIFAGIAHLRSRRQFFHRAERWILGLCVLINLLSLHILTSRSGIVAFYGALVVLTLILIVRKRYFQFGAIVLAFVVFAPVISYYTIPSFQTRVNVTRYDIEQSINPQEHLYLYSLGMRMLAWRTSWRVFLQHPLLGTAPADLETELLRQYQRDGVSLNLSTPMHMPHNQYMEHLAGLGVVGIFAMIFVLLQPVIFKEGENSIVFLSFLVMFMLIMLVESLLERQITIAFYSIFYLLLPKMNWLRI